MKPNTFEVICSFRRLPQVMFDIVMRGSDEGQFLAKVYRKLTREQRRTLILLDCCHYLAPGQSPAQFITKRNGRFLQEDLQNFRNGVMTN